MRDDRRYFEECHHPAECTSRSDQAEYHGNRLDRVHEHFRDHVQLEFPIEEEGNDKGIDTGDGRRLGSRKEAKCRAKENDECRTQCEQGVFGNHQTFLEGNGLSFRIFMFHGHIDRYDQQADTKQYARDKTSQEEGTD